MKTMAYLQAVNILPSTTHTISQQHAIAEVSRESQHG